MSFLRRWRSARALCSGVMRGGMSERALAASSLSRGVSTTSYCTSEMRGGGWECVCVCVCECVCVCVCYGRGGLVIGFFGTAL